MVLILGVSTIVVYWRVQFADFVHFDDFVYIAQNPDVLNGISRDSILWAFTKSHWHPLTWLSHMLDVQMSGIDPRGHHITNLLIHLTNTLLLFFALRRLTGHGLASGFVAALFAVHPLQVESVAWVAQRKTLLCGLFWMLCITVYGSFVKKPTRVLYLLMILFFILGLMSKWMIVTLPFVLLLLDVWPLDRMRRAADDKDAGARRRAGQVWYRVKEKVPLFLLSAYGCIIAYLGQKSIGAVQTLNDFPLGYRLANALVSYVSYIEKTLWPKGLAVFYPYPQSIPLWKTAAALVVLVLITCLVLTAARKCPYVLVGWLWFLGTLVPVIGLVQVGMQAMADRYAYLPMIGLFIVIVWGVQDLLSRWRYGSIATVAVLGVFGLRLMVAAHHQVGYWANSISLFEHALSVTSGNYLAHNNLGAALLERGRIEAAATQFQRALTIEPGLSEASRNLESARRILDKSDTVAENRRRFLAAAPAEVFRHYRAGDLLKQQGHPRAARASFQTALMLQPGFIPALDGLGVTYAMEGKYAEALSVFEQITNIWPEGSNAFYRIACIYARQRRVDQAIYWLKSALDKGFNDRDRIQTDENLANVRTSPEFIEMVKNM